MEWKCTYIIVFLLMSLSLWSQNNVPFDEEHFPGRKQEMKKAKENLEDGIILLEDGRFDQAFELFREAYEVNPDNARLNFYIGRALAVLNEPRKSLEHLQKAYLLGDQQTRPEIAFDYAKALHRVHRFDNAIIYYKEYLKSLTPEQMKETRGFIMKKIEECNVGKEQIRDSIRVYIEKLEEPVNTRYDEYSPYVNADESVLYFTSRRPGSLGGAMDDMSEVYYEDVYVSRMENGEWQAPENPGKPLNTKYHDAVVGLAPDGQKLYVYRSKNNGDIFESVLEGQQWGKPRALDRPVNSPAHEPTASFTYDGRGIYFVSDREGGYGGKDIYYSGQDEQGNWSEPQNLGAEINTEYDEDGVFMHPDGRTLYFSSQGHATMGGYDIFRSKNTGGQWEQPVNLGFPINTAEDDIFFSVTASGRFGYFSSSRDGSQDIYRIHFLGPSKPLVNSTRDILVATENAELVNQLENVIAVETPNLTLMKGRVLDEETKKPLAAQIELVDNTTGKTLAGFKSNSLTGSYLVSLPAGKNYGLAVKAEGFLFHSENFDIPEKETYREVVKDIYLKPIKIGKSIVLNNVFFDFDVGDKVKKESIPELNRVVALLKDNPGLKVQISGHTDNVGTDAYNRQLSMQRAKTVVEYLISKGIDSERLSYKGYGSQKPVADNKTEEGRQKNRRTEFKITG